MDRYEARLTSLYPEMVGWRRYLHRHPELSFHEVRTAGFVAERLREWGLQVSTNVGGNGVVGRLEGGIPGRTVALRADMDALPIQDEKACDYASETPGVMHACGHDAHTSTLLALAKILSERKSELRGNIVFIFQHAEEVCPGGASSMIEGGALNGVEAIYGVHLWTPLPYGTVASAAGPVMAAADQFQIEIRGKGGHGGLPHEAVDSVIIGSHLVVNLQSIVSRNVDPTEPAVVSVGSLRSGSNFNVIAETCLLQGTVRSFSEKIRDQVSERIEQIAEHTCRMFGAQYKLDYSRGYPPVVNDPEHSERFFNVSGSLFGSDKTTEMAPLMAAEDFAYYLHRVPGCFMFVGAGNENQGIINPHHHPKFDIDERSMLVSAKLMLHMALSFLNE
jgi:amidohydrolase